MAEKVVIGNAELWHGDCREVLPLVQADAVVTDPPYGISLDTDYSSLAGSTRTYAPIHGDNEQFDPQPWLARWPCAFFGAEHFAQVLPAGGTFHVWDKRVTAKPNMFADFESWWTSWPSGPSRIFRFQWVCGVHPGLTPERVEHPTVKPVQVMCAAMQKSTHARILDPYMGSGSTGLACHTLGRAFVGIERERKYFDIACERISRAQAQGSLIPLEQTPVAEQQAMDL